MFLYYFSTSTVTRAGSGIGLLSEEEGTNWKEKANDLRVNIERKQRRRKGPIHLAEHEDGEEEDENEDVNEDVGLDDAADKETWSRPAMRRNREHRLSREKGKSHSRLSQLREQEDKDEGEEEEEAGAMDDEMKTDEEGKLANSKWRRNREGGEGKSKPIVKSSSGRKKRREETIVGKRKKRRRKAVTVDEDEDEDENELSPSTPSLSPSPSVYHHPSKPIPPWVINYNLTYHFDWTWLKSGDFDRYLRDRTNPSLTSLSSSPDFSQSTATIEPASYIRSHPNDGVIVDDYPMIPNPVPHPLPGCRDWSSTCRQLNIQAWYACRFTPTELSSRLPGVQRHIAIGLYKAYVDKGSCHPVLPGTLYNEKVTLVWQRWTNGQCWNQPIRAAPNVQEYEELVDTVGVYTGAPGHFGPQQLPRLIRLLAISPSTAKVLHSTGSFALELLDVCVERGIVTRDRLIPFDSRKTYAAKVVYRSETSPYWSDDGHYVHDITDMQVVHRALARELPDQDRNAIVVVKRTGSRAVVNHDEVVSLLRRLLPSSLSHLRIEIFTADGHVRDHISLFERAQLIVAPHGAGLLNVYWSKQGGATHVIELGYNHGMILPDMYFEMSSHCGHRYWLCKGEGEYSGGIKPDMEELEWMIKEIYQQLEDRKTKQEQEEE